MEDTMEDQQWDGASLAEAEFPPIRWAVNGLVPEGITLLAGPPKSGKSWMALDFAIGVATGTNAMGDVVCEPGDVYYAALEDTPRRMQTRQLTALHGRETPERVDYVFDMPNIDRGGLAQVEAWLQDHPDARLVIIDVYGKIKGAGKGYEADYALVDKFRQLSKRYKSVAIVLVTHTVKKINKNDPFASIVGGVGLTGAVDASMVLLRQRGEQVGTLWLTGKDVEEAATPIELREGRWEVCEPAPEPLSESRQAVLSAIGGGDLTPKSIAGATGMAPNTVRQLLFKMAKDGQVERTAEGSYRACQTAA